MGRISVLILLHLALSLNMFDASAFWNIFLFGFQKVHYLIIRPHPLEFLANSSSLSDLSGLSKL